MAKAPTIITADKINKVAENLRRKSPTILTMEEALEIVHRGIDQSPGHTRILPDTPDLKRRRMEQDAAMQEADRRLRLRGGSGLRRGLG